MGPCPKFDCTASFISPPPFESNPDISGIGVLVGFLATAYLTLGLQIVHYVLVFNPAEAGLTGETRHVNPIDEMVLKFVAKWVARPQKTWEKAIEKGRKIPIRAR
ncbi:hypothetical protein V495_04256 [Pseudogymnoascus sp. VKM F-4514 (FW-929)]|nr:hypothetical protein V495_04256 [Pseudogymnoascus sp. VKM F-4514 (FW-929)]KFY57571.1 hypothetical protein V497_05415 [Pseudogymnoascus sp. VKM F-4516 (FW-969)]